MDTDNGNLSTEHQPPGSAKRPSDTLDRDRTDPAKGSPAKGAHQFGDDGPGDPGFATNGE